MLDSKCAGVRAAANRLLWLHNVLPTIAIKSEIETTKRGKVVFWIRLSNKLILRRWLSSDENESAGVWAAANRLLCLHTVLPTIHWCVVSQPPQNQFIANRILQLWRVSPPKKPECYHQFSSPDKTPWTPVTQQQVNSVKILFFVKHQKATILDPTQLHLWFTTMRIIQFG